MVSNREKSDIAIAILGKLTIWWHQYYFLLTVIKRVLGNKKKGSRSYKRIDDKPERTSPMLPHFKPFKHPAEKVLFYLIVRMHF